MQFSLPLLVLAFSVVAAAAACAGVLITGVPEISRRAVPVSGTLLVLISLLWILPELARLLGWSAGLAIMLGALSMLWLIDRFVYPVCPSCSSTHDHHTCSTRLHGFAGPLIVASLLHSVFDGWVLAAGGGSMNAEGGSALSLGVAIHKIPEAFAFGVILRAAINTKTSAMRWAIVTQTATFAGAMLEILAAPYLGAHSMAVLLAIGGGMFLYLGVHAVHGEWKRRAAGEVRIS